MTTIQVLQAMREKIAQGWCQNFMATDNDGRPVCLNSETAVCWCLSAAHEKYRHDGMSFMAAWDVLRELCGGPVVSWNDTPGRTQAEVLDLLDRAIERADADRLLGRCVK